MPPILFRLQDVRPRGGVAPLMAGQHPLPTSAGSAFILCDNFDDNSQDTAKWTIGQLKGPSATTAGVTVSETSQRLEVTPATSVGGLVYSGYVSSSLYNFAGSAIFAQMSLSATLGSSQEVYLSFGPNTSNIYQCLLSGGQIYLQKTIAGSVTNISNFAYVAATHSWWRLRHDPAADTINIDTASSTAADPPLESEWTNRISSARDTALVLSSVLLAVGSGTAGSTASPATARFDGFNIATVAPAGALAVGLSAETDTALGLALALGVGLSIETDSALALGAVQVSAVGLSSETDTAFALTGVQKRAVGLASETDTALGLGLARGVGMSVETDSALALSGKLIRAIGLSTETDAAFALTLGGLSVGVCLETDTARALGIAIGIGRATETDAALGRGIAVGVGRAGEIDTAFALTYLLARPVGLASETDTALTLAAVQRRSLSVSTETDSALGLGVGLGIMPANDNSTAFALAAVIINPAPPPPRRVSQATARSGNTFATRFRSTSRATPRRATG